MTLRSIWGLGSRVCVVTFLTGTIVSFVLFSVLRQKGRQRLTALHPGVVKPTSLHADRDPLDPGVIWCVRGSMGISVFSVGKLGNLKPYKPRV